MDFILTECPSSTIANDFAVLDSAFGNDAPLINVLFPSRNTSSGFAQGVKRLQEWQETDEHASFVHAVSSSLELNSGIVGFAVWTFMQEPPSEELDETEDVSAVWGQYGKDEEQFARQLWRNYVQPRRQAIKESGGKGCYVLELMAIHLEAHRQGVGKALMDWGLKKADELRVEAVVESTSKGLRLYEKCGFVATIPEIKFNVDQKFADRQVPKLIFLKRPARSA